MRKSIGKASSQKWWPIIAHTQSQHCNYRVQASVERAPETLIITYVVHGDINQIKLPKPAAMPQRRDGLWSTTCFELFVKGAAGQYCEWNFAPSGDWAAYSFTDYRSGQKDLDVAAPVIVCSQNAAGLNIKIAVPWDKDKDQHLGLSVILEWNGQLTYWALRHAAGKPDFHHDDCFCLLLD